MSFVFVFDRGKTLSGTQYKSTAALKSQSGLICSVTLWVKHDNSDDTHQPKTCVCVCVQVEEGSGGLSTKEAVSRSEGSSPGRGRQEQGVRREVGGHRLQSPAHTGGLCVLCCLSSLQGCLHQMCSYSLRGCVEFTYILCYVPLIHPAFTWTPVQWQHLSKHRATT